MCCSYFLQCDLKTHTHPPSLLFCCYSNMTFTELFGEHSAQIGLHFLNLKQYFSLCFFKSEGVWAREENRQILKAWRHHSREQQIRFLSRGHFRRGFLSESVQRQNRKSALIRIWNIKYVIKVQDFMWGIINKVSHTYRAINVAKSSCKCIKESIY